MSRPAYKIEPNNPPPRVKAALEHVRSLFPNITTVIFLGDARWRYLDDYFEMPHFGNKVDVSILEAAVGDLDVLPAIYRLDVPWNGQ